MNLKTIFFLQCRAMVIGAWILTLILASPQVRAGVGVGAGVRAGAGAGAGSGAGGSDRIKNSSPGCHLQGTRAST